jgi:FMN-dependent NADH-azoreductase
VTFLLHLDSGANRTGESITRELSRLFAETWQTQHGPLGYRYRDLIAEPVPPIDTAYCVLGRHVERHGLVPPAQVAAFAQTPGEQQAWAVTHPLITELLEAETVLLGVPMYNFSIPAALKTWIDRVTFPGALNDPNTGAGLLGDTSVVLITARGGAYGPGTPRQAYDFQLPYLRAYFAERGVREENLHVVTAEMTLAGLAPHLAWSRPLAARSLAAARQEVTTLATTLPRPASRAAS